jgi:hypothetical protein
MDDGQMSFAGKSKQMSIEEMESQISQLNTMLQKAKNDAEYEDSGQRVPMSVTVTTWFYRYWSCNILPMLCEKGHTGIRPDEGVQAALRYLLYVSAMYPDFFKDIPRISLDDIRQFVKKNS